ncbi:MAG: PilN domain-containing protein [Brasilonema octagenarum HA4186-MV1]|jgi:type IV pilus assembly protein PilN|uniref:Fimbrial protein n=1 Tax=Brasilonema octagenarum UFV-OR1 TaxID=417115 RepID=A0ABX1MD11_9CYAN|nr:PilN domain-containing protein [Brasilonema octagenarum]MBW4627767.1 PilN domain-containing protein [Brasilonema octagenarum HA4186-MV1]NMF63807.1 fimbrial protein [Brasilonema octagenarum UFV-OR1]
MYNIDINFLKNRKIENNFEEKQLGISLPTGNLTPVYIGLVVGLLFPALVGVGWWFVQSKNTVLEQNIAQMEQEKKRLEVEIESVNKIQVETSKIKQETQALVSVFDQIRPWSAMLQDLRDRIPTTVQIDSIKQIAPTTPTQGQSASNPAGSLEISGFARSFSDVNDFTLTLQQSRFFKAAQTKIITAELVDAPIQPGTTSATSLQMKPPQIVKYTIQSSLSDIPASEFIRELEQKGTVGLVTRIRSMQQTGVIPR